ncbi:LURP-one-related/scramblase family protein [Streptococcus sp. H31]|uniref:LURP-one-related/scramblase family protein n=1 Tax=Streptococcus huangxiaojuni TaxID=3237239 RepID=UPI0034A39DC8
MEQIFHIKQKFWTLGGQFVIKDDSGNSRYIVTGSFMEVPKSYTIREEPSGRFVSQISKRLLTFLPRFDIELADGSQFQIVKELTWLRPRYRVDNLELSVEGDFWNKNFRLYQGESLLAQIAQEWLTVPSAYHIEIFDDSVRDLVMSLVIAIDCIKADQAAVKSH